MPDTLLGFQHELDYTTATGETQLNLDCSDKRCALAMAVIHATDHVEATKPRGIEATMANTAVANSNAPQ
jgi:hypothetical protein